MAESLDVRSIFERHHLGVFRYLRRILGSSADAEDLTQETFLRVMRGLPGYRPDGREAAWVYEIARNLALNRRRDVARRPAIQSAIPEIPNTAPPQVELQQALSTLPDLDRDCFLLRESGGLGYAEIAAACGITEDAVRSRIHRARTALRAALAGTR
ncbi:MAG TPA: RNA polymerase sigma factor [Candidatus Polarisedimenticolaceae bacterium]